MKTLKHYLSVSLTICRQSLQRMVEYKANLLGWLIANPVQFIVGFATIKFVVEEFGVIDGWDYGQLAFIFGISVMSHGLNCVFFHSSWMMGRWIMLGDFDRYLVRPMNVLYQFYFMEINLVGFTDMIPGLCVFIYGCIQVGFQPTLGNLLSVLGMLIGATAIRGGIYLILGCVAFWTKSNNPYRGYTQQMFDRTSQYPISIYPKALQIILTYIIPLGWVTYYPGSEFLGKETELFVGNAAVWTSLAIGIGTFVVAAVVFNQGLKQYESAGN